MKKAIIAMDISSTRRGGPYVSTMNLIHSNLRNYFDFRTIEYKTYLGRGINLKRILDLRKQIREINPTIILCTGLQISGFNVMLAALSCSIKHRIIVLHGSSLEANNFSLWKKIIMYFIEYLTLWMSTAYYGVSKYSSTLSATKFFKRKSKGYIYNIPSLKSPEHQVSKESLGFSHNDIVIASSGRITEEKGFKILQEVIHSIKSPHIKFLIIGDGEYLSTMKSALEEEIKQKKVVFTGYRSDVIELLNCVDIFVLATLHETLSVSLLEAGYCSIPLIATRVGGIPEIIDDGYNGFLIPLGDVEGFINAIEKLSSQDSIRQEMGKNARISVTTKFSQEKLEQQVMNVLINELNKNKS